MGLWPWVKIRSDLGLSVEFSFLSSLPSFVHFPTHPRTFPPLTSSPLHPYPLPRSNLTAAFCSERSDHGQGCGGLLPRPSQRWGGGNALLNTQCLESPLFTLLALGIVLPSCVSFLSGGPPPMPSILRVRGWSDAFLRRGLCLGKASEREVWGWASPPPGILRALGRDRRTCDGK